MGGSFTKYNVSDNDKELFLGEIDDYVKLRQFEDIAHEMDLYEFMEDDGYSHLDERYNEIFKPFFNRCLKYVDKQLRQENLEFKKRIRHVNSKLQISKMANPPSYEDLQAEVARLNILLENLNEANRILDFRRDRKQYPGYDVLLDKLDRLAVLLEMPGQ
jgi:hypothetical protein